MINNTNKLKAMTPAERLAHEGDLGSALLDHFKGDADRAYRHLAQLGNEFWASAYEKLTDFVWDYARYHWGDAGLRCDLDELEAALFGSGEYFTIETKGNPEDGDNYEIKIHVFRTETM